MGLIRSLFWFCIFLASTFAFTVLFEHGPMNFAENAKKEFNTLSNYYNAKIDKKKDDSETLGH